ERGHRGPSASARAPARRGRRVRLPHDPVRSGRLLCPRGQRWTSSGQSPAALRGPSRPRAARARAGREAPSRCDGVLAALTRTEGGEHDGEEEGGQEEEVAFQRVSEVPLEGGAASSRSRDERREVIVNGE